MLKKSLAMLLAVVLALSMSVVAFAQQPEQHTLKFNDGKFVIVNICDMQDSYPASKTMIQFIVEVLAEYKPDIVVLGGDNTVGPKETKAQAIEEICNIFIENDTYFTLVFGNHDDEQQVDRETLFGYYKLYGGEYCLAYDAVEALTGVGTHNLPVYSSDGSKLSFNLWMFDSNTYAYNEKGEEVGYDCVHTDQIDWYKAKAAELAEQNGGEVVPAMAFQHIIVREVYDALFVEAPEALASRVFDGVSYSFLPKVYNIDEGLLFEFPCPGYYNYGQFDAFLETGDVVATFSGHDHVNNYSVNYKGIDIVNTAGATFSSYGKEVVRGCRVITIDESNPREYETDNITVAEMSLKSGSKITEQGEANAFTAILALVGDAFLNGFVWVTRYALYALRLVQA